MRSQITAEVRHLLDQTLQMADEQRAMQDRLVSVMCALLKVDAWDTHAREKILRAVREARCSLEDLLFTLHVEVE